MPKSKGLNLKVIVPLKKFSKTIKALKTIKCDECKKYFNPGSIAHHSSKRWNCAHCKYSTKCKSAFALHKHLCRLGPKKNARYPFGIPLQNRSKDVLACRRCNFSTANGAAMIEHLQTFHKRNENVAIRELNGSVLPTTTLEKTEALVFGMASMANRLNPNSESERKTRSNLLINAFPINKSGAESKENLNIPKENDPRQRLEEFFRSEKVDFLMQKKQRRLKKLILEKPVDSGHSSLSLLRRSRLVLLKSIRLPRDIPTKKNRILKLL